MTQIEQRAAAASARGAAIAQRTDRPSQRRSAPEAGSRAVMTARAAIDVQVRADETKPTAHFTGVASAYEKPYVMYDMFGEYTEVVTSGAGSVSLARTDLDVPLVLQHAQLRRIARTTNGSLTLSETDDALNVDAPELDMRDHDVLYIVPKLLSKLVDEMSFAFRIIRGEWSPDWMTYRINEYDIHRGDVSIVGFGANPHTIGELRALEPAQKRGRDLIPLGETRLLPLS